MCGIIRKTFRLGFIAAGILVVGAVAYFAAFDEGRTKTMVRELQSKVLEKIDDNIDDPSALRAQLHEMEREYPERIAQVRGDLAELDGEMRSLERERAISERVVALVDADLGRVEGALATHDASSSNGLTSVHAIEIANRVVSPQRAKGQLHQMKEQRLVYANRAADAQHDYLYLSKQRARLQDLLTKLETERAEFQSQILGLSRQIDSIARNDRLITLLDRRNRTIDECTRYDSVSLDQITGRLAQITSRQEAELDVLSNAEAGADYEDMARLEIANEELEARTAVSQAPKF